MAKTNSIQDQTFLFTGTLTEFTREEAEALVEQHGGKVLSGVTSKLNYLVVGEDAGSKLDKAKKLGTVKILKEKEFLKMVPTRSAIAPAPSNPKSKIKVKAAIFRNELSYNGKAADLLKLIKKHGGKEIYKDGGTKVAILKLYENEISYQELISNDTIELFHFNESQNKLILNRIVSGYDDGEEFNLNEDFLNELAVQIQGDFKLSFLNRNSWTLVYFGRIGDSIEYYETSLSDWEDPYCFEEEPYFVKLAKEKGVKMKKNEDGEKMYDSDEIYDIIYDFRDSLISWPETYLEIAPEWYLKMKSVSH